MWQQLQKFNLQIMTHFYPTEIVSQNTQRKCWLQQHLVLWKLSSQWLIDRFHWHELLPASNQLLSTLPNSKTNPKFHSHAEQIYTYPQSFEYPGLPFVVVVSQDSRRAALCRSIRRLFAIPYFFHLPALPFSMGAQQHGKRFRNRYPASFKF